MDMIRMNKFKCSGKCEISYGHFCTSEVGEPHVWESEIQLDAEEMNCIKHFCCLCPKHTEDRIDWICKVL